MLLEPKSVIPGPGPAKEWVAQNSPEPEGIFPGNAGKSLGTKANPRPLRQLRVSTLLASLSWTLHFKAS